MLIPPITLASGTVTTATIATAVDISGVPAGTTEYQIDFNINSLTAASGTPAAIITVEDSVDTFTHYLTQAQVSLLGTENGGYSVSIPKRQSPNLRIGTAGATARVNIQLLGGTSPSLTYSVILR